MQSLLLVQKLIKYAPLQLHYAMCAIYIWLSIILIPRAYVCHQSLLLELISSLLQLHARCAIYVSLCSSCDALCWVLSCVCSLVLTNPSTKDWSIIVHGIVWLVILLHKNMKVIYQGRFVEDIMISHPHIMWMGYHDLTSILCGYEIIISSTNYPSKIPTFSWYRIPG